ncbi:MAG: hypothetical protein MPK31_07885 [Gammaproteobacteria bacterium]|nr:hypothetical protein [Gammaproteobacteria bacterium]
MAKETSDIDALRARAVAAMGNRLGVEFTRQPRGRQKSCFTSVRNGRLVALPSKKYEVDPYQNYWYTSTPHQQKFLEDATDAYLVLACENLPHAYVFGYEKFKKWAELAAPRRQQIYIFYRDGSWQMHFGTAGLPYIPLSGYELPLDQGSPTPAESASGAAAFKVAESKTKPLTPSPPPLAERGGYLVERDPNRPAQTYLLRFGSSNIWKVGWAHDATKRCDDINTHIPSELLSHMLDDPLWRIHKTQDWENAALAYQMEQRVLRELAGRGFTTQNERAKCDAKIIMEVWSSAISVLSQ